MLDLLKRFGRPYAWRLIIGPATKLVEVVFDLLTPLVVARMIDEGVASRRPDVVVRYGLVLAGMAVAGILIVLICQKCASVTAQGMGTDMRRELYRRVNRLSFAQLDRFGTASLSTRIINDVNQVQLAVALAIRQLIRWPFLAVGSLIAAVVIDWRMGLIFAVCLPLVGAVFALVMAKSVPLFKTVQAKLDRVAQVVREGLGGARVVRAFVRERNERARLVEASDAHARVATAVGRLSAVLNPATFLVMNLGVCAILWSGAVRVDAGGLTQGQVVAFVNYMTQALLSIVYVANLVVVFTKASASAARIAEVLDCEPERQAGAVCPSQAARDAEPGSLQIPDASARPVPALDIASVSFTYAGAQAPALSNISLSLPAGAALGVIGGTGSGKTTLLELMAGLYEPACGEVRLFGKPVDAWDETDLRRAVAVVPQRSVLFAGTIRSNLCWRDPAAPDDALWDALDAAQAAEFVRALPKGLDAPVATGGTNFSGGQRQRLAIARALVGSPRLLMLDDSYSALDVRTEAALRQALAHGVPAPLTQVVVSQRVSAVRNAQAIAVLDHGRLVGLGTHDELAATCEVYREISTSQQVPVPPVLSHAACREVAE